MSLLYLSAFIASFGDLHIGITYGWSSPTLPKLLSNGTENPLPEKLSTSEATTLAALNPVGSIFGPIAAGFLIQKYGKKQTLVITLIPAAISYFLVAIVPSYSCFCVMRFLSGITAGCSICILPIYVAEIAESSIRGRLTSFQLVAQKCGYLFSFSIAPFVSVNFYNLLCGCFVTMLIIMFVFFLPRSPYDLVHFSKTDQAKIALHKLRKYSSNSLNIELNRIKYAVEDESNRLGFRDLFKSKVLRKGFFIVLFLITAQLLTGMIFIMYYTYQIFENRHTNIIIIAFMLVLASTITPIFVDNYGRRTLLLISGFGMTTFLVLLILYFSVRGVIFSCSYSYDMVVVIILSCFIVTYCIGFGAVPFVVYSEIFQSSAKPPASAILMTLYSAMAAVLAKYSIYLYQAVGYILFYSILAINCTISSIIIYFVLPETSKKTFEEIQKMLS